MASDFVMFFLRMGLIITFWLFTWRLIEPRTRAMRIVRAAVLATGLFGIMTLLRVMGS
jgi:hypothetical protein